MDRKQKTKTKKKRNRFWFEINFQNRKQKIHNHTEHGDSLFCVLKFSQTKTNFCFVKKEKTI